MEEVRLRVLVIGSGFAGTACARLLKQQGIQYKIVEGNNYAGGRTRTLTLGKGETVDIGASFIHGTEGNPLANLCDTFNIPYNPMRIGNKNKEIIEFQSTKLSHSEMSKVSKQFRDAFKQAKLYLREEMAKGNFSLSLEDGLQHALSLHPVVWKEGSPEDKYFQYRKWVYEEYEGANWDELSMLQLEAPGCAGGNYLIENGYKTLLDEIHDGLEIDLNAEVKRIEYEDDNMIVVTVKYTREGSSMWKRFYCEYVVSTVSLGVLKKSILIPDSIDLEKIETGLIHFVPPLPSWKQQNFNQLDIGLMNKVVLEFDRKFWNFDRLTYIGDIAGDFPWFDQIGESSLLVWTACRFADYIEENTKEDIEVVEHCMRILRGKYPRAPNPISSFVTRWRSNPFTRGSYSFIKPDTTREDLETLDHPVKNLYFCGEAFSVSQMGMVHGAFLTGENCAKQILLRMGK